MNPFLLSFVSAAQDVAENNLTNDEIWNKYAISPDNMAESEIEEFCRLVEEYRERY